MEFSKIPIPDQTYLCEIVSDDKAQNHAIYFLGLEGQLIDYVIVKNAHLNDIVSLLNHMFIISFTTKEFWNMKCETMFNQIFEPDRVGYDSILTWQMDPELVAIIRHFGKIKNVKNYLETDEFKSEAHIVDDFISARPTPIEKESEEVHKRGMVARTKMLKIIEEWVI